MIFRLLLYCFGLLMRIIYNRAARKDAAFRKRLTERNISIVIKTADGKKARQYILRNGEISSAGKDHPDPDISIIWSSATRALFTLLKPTPKIFMEAIRYAIINDKLKIEFKIEPFSWFATTFRQMMTVFSK